MRKKMFLSMLIILLIVLLSSFSFASTIPENVFDDAQLNNLGIYGPLVQQIQGSIVLTIICVVFFILSLIILVVCQCFIFESANEKWWKALIPIYNTIVIFKMVGLSPWLLLLYLPFILSPFIIAIGILTLSPAIIIFAILLLIVLSLVLFILNIVFLYKLSKTFGRGAGFTLGLLVFPVIFYCILAFGDNEYVYNENTVKYKNDDEDYEITANAIKKNNIENKKTRESKSNKYIVVDPETGEEIDPRMFKPMDLDDIKPKSDFFK